MDFLTFLNDYEHEDVSKVKDILKANKAKEKAIIEAVFKSEYPSKKEALFNLNTYFTDDAKAPKGVDMSYVKENIKDLKSKIENLTEGDIRIIIHNHEDSKGGSLGFEEEGVKPKKRRSRKLKKQDFTKVPATTGVVYEDADGIEKLTSLYGRHRGRNADWVFKAWNVRDDIWIIENEDDSTFEVIKRDIDNEDDECEILFTGTPNEAISFVSKQKSEMYDSQSDMITDIEEESPKDDLPLPNEDDIVADVDTVDVDEKIITDVLPEEDAQEKSSLKVSGKPTKMRWSDIVKQVHEQEKERDGLIEELATMDLDEEELKQATSMAESGEIVEDDSKVSSAASIISRINKL